MKFISSTLCKIILPALILAGCSAVTYDYTSTPVSQNLTTDFIRVGFTPEKARGNYYSWFELSVENLSSGPIEIDWNRTFYVLDGKNRGPFVWEGIDPEQIKNKTVPGTSLLPGQTITREISPLAKIAMAQRKSTSAGKETPGLYAGILPQGENSIRLAIIANGKPVYNTLTIVITEQVK